MRYNECVESAVCQVFAVRSGLAMPAWGDWISETGDGCS